MTNNKAAPIDYEELRQKIENSNVYDVAKVSALDPGPRLSARLNNQVWLKREDQQSVFSFKLRGAYNKIKTLSSEQLANGVVAASAGNHAQGVALSAQRLGIHATIVMPRTTPSIKVSSVKTFGAEVQLVGDTYDEASAYAIDYARQENRAFIPPYDDIDVIAGQGTVGKEVLEQLDSDPYAIFVPVGGGGLIAGIAAWVKKHSPQTKIIGVEPEDAATLYAAMLAKKRVVLPQIGIFADGVAVKQIGETTFEIAKDLVDEVVLVSIDQICAAIKDIFEDLRVLSEPAGALAIAGMKKYVEEQVIEKKQLVAISSGANMNFDRLRHVAERAEIGEGHESLISVTIPEVKGSFLRFCQVLGKYGITEFNYRYADKTNAQIFVGVKFSDAKEEKDEVLADLRDKGYEVLDISDNEVAKLHLCHMVGGRAPALQDEVLYRFEFPERPGALLKFLQLMGSQWNISLFHYRNHGAAYGRVLVGMQVPEDESVKFTQFLEQLDYVCYNETDNPVYKQFLK